MGRAKQRGSFEERAAAAVARNESVERRLLDPKAKADPAMVKYRARYGTQRVVTRLVAAGLVGLVPVPRPPGDAAGGGKPPLQRCDRCGGFSWSAINERRCSCGGLVTFVRKEGA